MEPVGALMFPRGGSDDSRRVSKSALVGAPSMNADAG
jgi:hypothetical protein